MGSTDDLQAPSAPTEELPQALGSPGLAMPSWEGHDSSSSYLMRWEPDLYPPAGLSSPAPQPSAHQDLGVITVYAKPDTPASASPDEAQTGGARFLRLAYERSAGSRVSPGQVSVSSSSYLPITPISRGKDKAACQGARVDEDEACQLVLRSATSSQAASTSFV